MSLLAFVLLSLAQNPAPELVGATAVLLSVGADLPGAIHDVGGPAWVGYSVPAAAGATRGCGGVFDLERGGSYSSSSSLPREESSSELYVFTRVEAGRVAEVRAVTSGCSIRAGADPVYWVLSVATERSLDFLQGVVRQHRTEEIAEHALHAIAWHAGAAADDLLDGFAREPWPVEVRNKAVFWMGAARSERGFQSLAALLDDASSERELREQVVFALHVSEAEGATRTLIRVARRDRDATIRGKAVFWLGQEAGERASAAIVDAVRDDPDLDVKKQAVFALSQLPAAEGVPLLIEVAETHPQPEVRKKAFFWLGQSGDPQALALFEKVLR